nr:MAG TPA: hypothetical protein [Caudoviricetes sp.]
MLSFHGYCGQVFFRLHIRDEVRTPEFQDLGKHFIDGEHLELVEPVIDIIRNGVVCMERHDIGHVLKDLQVLDLERPALCGSPFIRSLQLGQVFENVPLEFDTVQTRDSRGGAECNLLITDFYCFLKHCSHLRLALGFFLWDVHRLIPILVGLCRSCISGAALYKTVCTRVCSKRKRLRTRLDSFFLGLGLDGRTGSTAVVHDMTDGTDITIKLEEQCELDCLGVVGNLHKHTVLVQCLFQNLGSEPFRDKGDLKVTAVAVVGVGTEVHDAVRIERRRFTFGIQADADSTGDCLRLGIGKSAVFVHCQFGSVDILQIVFNFITHSV